jgi:hypothetical protein
LWHVIIPHFINYPLYGAKHLSFIKFVHVLSILYPYHNKNKPALLLGQVIYLAGIINPGTKRNLSDLENYFNKLNLNSIIISKSILPLTYSINNKNSFNKLSIINVELNIYFIIGLIEGDGSFYVGLRNNRKIRFGFNLTTHINELDLLYKIKFRLNCGIVRICLKN